MFVNQRQSHFPSKENDSQSHKQNISNILLAIDIIIGVIALAIMLGGLGAHQSWWTSPCLNYPNQITMIAVGSTSLTIALVIGTLIARKNIQKASNDRLDNTSIPVKIANRPSHELNNTSTPIRTAGRSFNNFPMASPTDHTQNQPHLENRENNYLKKQIADYEATIPSYKPSWNTAACLLNTHFENGSIGALSPDYHSASSLVLAFEKHLDPEIFFAPSDLHLDREQDKAELVNILKNAFVIGKKMVVVRFIRSNHSVAAGFQVDGSFKIIDSMFGGDRYAREIAEVLNRGNIHNTQGLPIHFAGKYINTHLQRGGNACAFLSTLYCYHMAVKKNLDAFTEVNGAFLEGRLKCFEDYTKISGAQKICSLAGKHYSYDPFIRSWAYRAQGFQVDSWEQLSWREIVDFVQESTRDDSGTLFMIPMKFNTHNLPKYYAKNPNIQRTFVFEHSGKKREIQHLGQIEELEEIPLLNLSIPIRNSLLQTQNTYLLFIDKTSSTPRLFKLKQGQKVYWCAPLLNGSIRETLVS